MPSRARVVLFVLLLITAVVALRAPAPGAPVPAADRTPATVVIGWLIVLVAPALLVLLYAGLRYRNAPARRIRRPRPARPRAGAALLGLAALLAVTVALAALARLLPPTRPTARGGTSGRQETPPPDSPPPPETAGSGASAVELAATAVAVALLLLLAVAVARSRRSVALDIPASKATGATPQPLASAAGEALTAVETPGSDPRAAIIGCYAAMERALADAPAAAPRPADAPADVLRRAAEQGQLNADTGRRLLGLFHEARYSTHPMTEADRSAAATTLRAILTELGRPPWRAS
ncbi:MAG: DUF4129 domain-containing protein [Actinophytocola sp.]|nr:DUF4129 domain-containing protein [Actinophytocola sp.]